MSIFLHGFICVIGLVPSNECTAVFSSFLYIILLRSQAEPRGYNLHPLIVIAEAKIPKLGKTPISSGNEQGKESNGIAGTSRILVG